MSRKQPVQRKHIPQRTCVVCRQTMDKRSLVRVINDPEMGLMIDPTGKRSGRGAYICESESCWERALTTEVLARALRSELTKDDLGRLHEMRAS